jgi:hypothetical protein
MRDRGLLVDSEDERTMRYRTAKSNEWIRPIRTGYKMMCCDCGLVHEIDFKIKKWGRGHKLIFRARRNERATAAARRAKRHKVLTTS